MHIFTEKPTENIIMAMRLKEKADLKNSFLDSKITNSRALTETAPLSG